LANPVAARPAVAGDPSALAEKGKAQATRDVRRAGSRSLDPEKLRKLRGQSLAVVFQDR